VRAGEDIPAKWPIRSQIRQSVATFVRIESHWPRSLRWPPALTEYDIDRVIMATGMLRAIPPIIFTFVVTK